MEITEETKERMWELQGRGQAAERWPSCLRCGLCDLGQVLSPLCASASSSVNGDL